MDPADETTRTPQDIVGKLEDWLEIVRTIPEIRVGCDNTADTVTVERVHIEVPSPSMQERCRGIARGIQAALRSAPVAMFVWASDEIPESTSRWLWADLFEEHLMPLKPAGFLVVEWVKSASDIPEWVPAPDLEVHLPAVYSSQESAHAAEDIADLLTAEGIFDEGEAPAHARTLLAGWQDRPSNVYASISAAVGRLKSL